MSSAFDWRAKAACRDKDPELFFPVGNTGAAYQQIEEAKAVCRTCKVIDACLKCALDTNQDYGVWGGLSEDERRALKRRASSEEARARPRTNPSRATIVITSVWRRSVPRANQSAISGNTHIQRAATESHGAERIASARERREAAVRETLGERPLAAVRAPARAPVEARAGSRAVS